MIDSRIKSNFKAKLLKEINNNAKLNKVSVEKMALSFQITDKNLVKELTEHVIVWIARTIAMSGSDEIKEKYSRIVELYNNQVNLSHRTSQSILLQQYSTPAPIGYLAGLFCRIDQFGTTLFEPSAGNGLLTIAAPNLKRVVVNEIDEVRNANLQEDGYDKVLQLDATKPFSNFTKRFDAVITNPPFGSLDRAIEFEGNYKIKVLDHLMALRALDTMKDLGRAAIIIGGHTDWDELGRIQAGKNRIFFSLLYKHYNVLDVINIDGKKLYSRQGTSFNVRLILIDGRKNEAGGVIPLKSDKDVVVRTFEDLFDRVMKYRNKNNSIDLLELEAEALALELELLEGLGAPYFPSSEACIVLDTQVPDSMDYEIHSALERLKRKVGSIDEYVFRKLGYKSHTELCKALSAEQTDAVALAISNIEDKGQGMIIGDQTGIGKGRIAAAMIRYAVHQKKQPIFLTEKANLFSDLYRDLEAIGSANLAPFIVNAKESKTDIKNQEGEVIYQAPEKTEQDKIISSQKLPSKYNFVCATYTQFNSIESKPAKPLFLRAIAQDNVIIMDESHNASGSSNTGEFLQSVLSRSKGVVFLSATFAKRPDNMPVYAMKTAMSEANMTKEDLVEAITKGGVALQEILSSQLVAEGQMIRRERSFEGIEVNYISLDKKEEEHKAIADNITFILRAIINFQNEFVSKEVKELDKIVAAEGKEVEVTKGTSKAGVDSTPYFSKVFNVINQMLFAIKAEEVANRAIERLKEGKKPVIAFSSTMGSFIEQLENENGMPVGDGDVINADFAEVLKKGLAGVMRYTEITPEGEREHKSFDISAFTDEAKAFYFKLQESIKAIATGVSISPIDVVMQIIEKAGYKVAEVTGRKYEVQLNLKTGMGMVKTRKRINTNDAFRQFNNNEVDVLMINQSGSTGASAHAIVTPKVPKEQVKQRVMIVLQAELDINTEVQKRGRINRTGQILKPIYDYINSSIPAEKRLMMMLQKKLKSLDANTSSNQKQSEKILSVEDFLNKYGDKVVKEYLEENPEINALLDDPLKMADSEKDVITEDAANKVSGRVAVLSTQMQADFYSEISSRYNDFIEILKQSGEYDLEVEAMDLEAETELSYPVKIGKGGESAFGENSILNKVEANVLRKPFTENELSNLLIEASKGKDAIEQKNEILTNFNEFSKNKWESEFEAIEEKYNTLIANVPNEKKIKAIADVQARRNAEVERMEELQATMRLATDKAYRTFEARKSVVERYLKFFHVGRGILYPEGDYQAGATNTKGVSLGVSIDEKKKNPYAPSSLRFRFALASSSKYIAIPATYAKINEIIGATYGMSDSDSKTVVANWGSLTKENTKNRSIRYIITGNILQAFKSFNGKLVSYTTKAGGVEKGILMPDHWEPAENQKIAVPIIHARKIIVSMSAGQSISTNENFGIIKQYGFYKLIVAASKQQGGKFYLNEEILALVEDNNFNKVSSQMVAKLDERNIEGLINILQDKFSQSIELTQYQYEIIAQDLPKPKQKEKIELPERKKTESNDDDLFLLEIEAEALALELELLNF